MGRIGLVVTLAALVGLACSGGGDGTERSPPTPAPPEVAPAAAPSIAPAAADEPPAALELIKGPISEDGLQAIFATPDLGTGRHRVAFALTSRTGLIDAPTATVQSFYDPDPETETWGEPVQTALAVFRPFPIVERGLYATHLNFDRTGMWAIRATVFGDDGASLQASLVFDVPERTLAPAVGDTAPRSDNRTADDVERLSQLTTGSHARPGPLPPHHRRGRGQWPADGHSHGQSRPSAPTPYAGRRWKCYRSLKDEFDGAGQLHPRGLLRQPRGDSGRPGPGRWCLRWRKSGACQAPSGRSWSIETVSSQAGSRASPRWKS